MRLRAPIIALLAFTATFSGAPQQGVPANVYLENPDDGTTAVVQLERLDGDGTRLAGRYVRVTSDKLSTNGQAVEGVGGAADFRYEPNTSPMADCTWHIEDCSLFDAVNVYYHIDRFAHEYWTDRLGVDISFQAAAITHVAGDGAYANRPPGTIKFGLGATMTKNAALDPDIIRHEYTHLVTTSLGFEVGIDSPVETRAVNEGIAHYFAASFSDDPRIGEWIVTCPPRQHCTGPDNDTEMATLATDPAVWNWNRGRPSDHLKYGACTRYYPLDGKCKIGHHNFTDVYTWGMIWGSALWDLREAVGAAAVDRLVVESLREFGGYEVRFDVALTALIDADRRVYAGQHIEAIADVFTTRGFSVAANVGSEDPTVPPSRFTLRLAGSNPITSEARLSFHLQTSARARLAIYDALGRQIILLHDGKTSPGIHDVVWTADSVPSGRYFAVITAGSRREAVLLIVQK